MSNSNKIKIIKKNNKKCNFLSKIILKNQKQCVIIYLSNIVNKQYCLQTNRLTRKVFHTKNINKGFVKGMLVQTLTPITNDETLSTAIVPQFVDLESAARYLASLFFLHKLKDTDSAIHCTLPKIEKLLAIVAIIQYKKGIKIFFEDILIKKCGVGFDCLDWPSEIIDMRKEDDYFNTGETNLPIKNNIVQASVVIPKLYSYMNNEQLPTDLCDLIDSVFFQFANYKASFLGAMFDDFKTYICEEQDDVYYVDSKKVIEFFSEPDEDLNGKNQVYDFILRT